MVSDASWIEVHVDEELPGAAGACLVGGTMIGLLKAIGGLSSRGPGDQVSLQTSLSASIIPSVSLAPGKVGYTFPLDLKHLGLRNAWYTSRASCARHDCAAGQLTWWTGMFPPNMADWTCLLRCAVMPFPAKHASSRAMPVPALRLINSGAMLTQ
jgi:hypothetical protein